jgi:hypothetical protein
MKGEEMGEGRRTIETLIQEIFLLKENIADNDLDEKIKELLHECFTFSEDFFQVTPSFRREYPKTSETIKKFVDERRKKNEEI